MAIREADAFERVVLMAAFLHEVGYRELANNGNQLRLTVSRRLWKEGLDDRILRLLFQYAKTSSANPIRLFAWWIDRPQKLREKLDELRSRSAWATDCINRIVSEEESKAHDPCPILQMPQRRSQ